MSKDSYTTIDQKIRRRQDFEGNSMSGKTFPKGCGYVHPGAFELRPPENAVYVVWSYSTPIAWVTPDGEGFVNETKYSVTTSRHQHACYSIWNERQRAERDAQREADWQEWQRKRDEREAKREQRRLEKEARRQRVEERTRQQVIKMLIAHPEVADGVLISTDPDDLIEQRARELHTQGSKIVPWDDATEEHRDRLRVRAALEVSA